MAEKDHLQPSLSPGYGAASIPRSLVAAGVAVIILTWISLLCLLWIPAHPPLYDLPNHVARHYLEYLKLWGAELPPFYAVEYSLVPNLGCDLLAPVLFAAFSPLTATRVLLTLCVVLYWLGTSVFVWYNGGFRQSAFVASLLLLPWVLNSQFFWGFINYYSGMGVAFLVLVQYETTWREDRSSTALLLINAALVCLVFCWHLGAWVVYGTLAGCYWAMRTLESYQQSQRLRSCLIASLSHALPMIPSMLMFAYYLSAHGGQTSSVLFNWGGLARKAYMPLTCFRGYMAAADVVAVIAWFAAAAALFPIFRRRTHSRDWLPLGMAGLALLYVILPFQFRSTSDADSRLLPPMLVCLVAWLGKGPLRGRRVSIGLSLLLVCLVVRYGSIAIAWDRLSRRLTDHARTFELIKPGSRVLSIVPAKGKEFPEEHFPCWSVIQRQTFVSNLFAMADQQPLRLTFDCPDPLQWREGSCEIDEAKARASFDYAWVYNPEDHLVRIPTPWRRLYSQNSLTLWEIR